VHGRQGRYGSGQTRIHRSTAPKLAKPHPISRRALIVPEPPSVGGSAPNLPSCLRRRVAQLSPEPNPAVAPDSGRVHFSLVARADREGPLDQTGERDAIGVGTRGLAAAAVAWPDPPEQVVHALPVVVVNVPAQATLEVLGPSELAGLRVPLRT